MSPGSRFIRAVISAASKAGTIPSLSVVHTLPSRRTNDAPRAFLATEAQRTVEQTIHEPLEAHWYFVELSAKLRGDSINHLAAYHRFADRHFLGPLRPVLEQIEDGDGKVMVGRHQYRASGDDSVPVVVGIAGEGDLKAIPHAD